MRLKNVVLLIVLGCFLSLPTYADGETGADLLLKYGFISGDNGNVMPEKELTRAEAAVILAEMNGVKAEAASYTPDSGFSDVAKDQWYAPYIAYGKAKGYMGGYPDGTFKPEAAVTAKEFAALLMNGMGYQGDYSFDTVLTFAGNKNVNVEVKGIKFIRGDAFEALWDAVNQPSKGSEVSIGVKLGKLTKADEGSKNTARVDDIVISKNNIISVQFTKSVDNSGQYAFLLTKYSNAVPVKVTWNYDYTIASLSSAIPFSFGDYILTISEPGESIGTSYNVKVEKQKIASIKYDSDLILRFDDYMGVIGYRAYDQYGEDVTNTALGQQLGFYASTDASEVVVDSSAGILVITHGRYDVSGESLKQKELVELVAIDDSTGFSQSQTLKISSASTGIYSIKINGVKDSEGNGVTLSYSNSIRYYLDLTIVDEYGNLVMSKDIYDHRGPGNQELLMVRCMNPDICSIVKTTNPKAENQVAYQIIFNKAPDHDMDLFFNAVAPFSESGFNNASLMIKVKK